jgi:hypothetical protein
MATELQAGYRALEGVAEISDAALARGEGERLVERIH